MKARVILFEEVWKSNEIWSRERSTAIYLFSGFAYFLQWFLYND